jgi:hypothetical protein
MLCGRISRGSCRIQVKQSSQEIKTVLGSLAAKTVRPSMNKIMVAMSDDMFKALEQERKARKLESIPETVRAVLGEYFKVKHEPN